MEDVKATPEVAELLWTTPPTGIALRWVRAQSTTAAEKGTYEWSVERWGALRCSR